MRLRAGSAERSVSSRGSGVDAGHVLHEGRTTFASNHLQQMNQANAGGFVAHEQGSWAVTRIHGLPKNKSLQACLLFFE